jgi:hypothetical protein
MIAFTPLERKYELTSFLDLLWKFLPILISVLGHGVNSSGAVTAMYMLPNQCVWNVMVAGHGWWLAMGI